MDDVLTIAQIEAQFASERALVEAPQTNDVLEVSLGFQCNGSGIAGSNPHRKENVGQKCGISMKSLSAILGCG